MGAVRAAGKSNAQVVVRRGVTGIEQTGLPEAGQGFFPLAQDGLEKAYFIAKRTGTRIQGGGFLKGGQGSRRIALGAQVAGLCRRGLGRRILRVCAGHDDQGRRN